MTTWTAASMGQKGGSAKSERKAAAVRSNGLKGGRPQTGVARPEVLTIETSRTAYDLDIAARGCWYETENAWVARDSNGKVMVWLPKKVVRHVINR